MGYLKGKSSLMIFDRHANLKYKYGSRSFWCRGYYVDTVGRNKKVIAEYIRNQLEEDYAADQISIPQNAFLSVLAHIRPDSARDLRNWAPHDPGTALP